MSNTDIVLLNTDYIKSKIITHEEYETILRSQFMTSKEHGGRRYLLGKLKSKSEKGNYARK